MADNTEVMPTQPPAETPVESAHESQLPTQEPTIALAEPIEGEPAAPVKPKRRIRTGRLFAGAIALGIIGGVAGGYTVQALRKPTPLPPLAVAQPVYPQSRVYDGTRPPALPAGQDDATIVNGDLTKLLLPTPAGAHATFLDHSRMDLVSEADTCENPASCFSTNLHDGVVRIADTAWIRSDGLYVEIRVFQYRPGYTNYADGQITNFSATNRTKIRMPDGIAAVGYEYFDSNNENDDHAVAVHGDLAVYFWVTSRTRVPDPSIIDGLIKQQMARL